jgi:hypothetical protein
MGAADQLSTSIVLKALSRGLAMISSSSSISIYPFLSIYLLLLNEAMANVDIIAYGAASCT